MIVPCAVVYLLYSFTFQPNRENNGFMRKWDGRRVAPQDTLMAEKTLGRICGVTDERIYVEGMPEKNRVIELGWDCRQLGVYAFSLPPEEKIRSRLECRLDSPYVHFFSGNGPDVFFGRLDDPSGLRRLHYPFAIFMRAVPVPGGRYLLRGFDYSHASTEQDFILWDPVRNIQVRKFNPFSVAGDLGIGTDGMMEYDSVSGQLVYVQYYRNGISLIDSGLSAMRSFPTIDTVLRGRMQTGHYDQGGSSQYGGSAPQFIVNWQCFMGEGRIYVNSLLRADNESASDFETYSAIDVYDLVTKKYLYSWHLPRLNGKRMYSFYVRRDRVVASYPGGVVTYRLL